MSLRRVETLVTHRFGELASGAVALILVGLITAVALGVRIDDAAKFADAVFKSAAVVIGMLWALNRYFTTRADELQIRFEATTDILRSVTSPVKLPGAFFCRVDVFNTSKILTPEFTQVVVVEAVEIVDQNVAYKELKRWPAEGEHPVAPIEPGAWAAVSIASPLDEAVRAIRVYTRIVFGDGRTWTWHRHFVVQQDRA